MLAGRSRGSASAGVDAVLCLVGDGPDRDGVERRAHELGIVRDMLFVGYQDDVAPYYAALRRADPPVGERGHAGQRDRVARGRARRSSRRASAACRTWCATASTASSSSRGDVDAMADAARALAADPELRPGWARPAAPRVHERYSVERLLDDIDRLYRALLAAR